MGIPAGDFFSRFTQYSVEATAQRIAYPLPYPQRIKLHVYTGGGITPLVAIGDQEVGFAGAGQKVQHGFHIPADAVVEFDIAPRQDAWLTSGGVVAAGGNLVNVYIAPLWGAGKCD